MVDSLKQLGRKAIALVVLLLAAFLLFKIVLGAASALIWTILAIAVIIAAIWALSQLL